jgi:hypothetical protein
MQWATNFLEYETVVSGGLEQSIRINMSARITALFDEFPCLANLWLRKRARIARVDFRGHVQRNVAAESEPRKVRDIFVLQRAINVGLLLRPVDGKAPSILEPDNLS